MKANMLSLDDLKVIAGQSREIIILDIAENPIGPTLTSDTFPGFDKIVSLNMSSCGLKHIESGIFRRMKKLTNIDLGFNMLTHIEAGTFEGLSDNLMTLSLKNNALTTIADGTFSRFSKLSILKLRNNILKSLPDLTGPTDVKTLDLKYNKFKDISRLGDSTVKSVLALSLEFNQIEHVPVKIFQKISVIIYLLLNFNSISKVSNRTLAGLKNLRALMMINNRLAFIPGDIFADSPLLQRLFLHGNAIKTFDGNAFRGLYNLKTLTLFDNPLNLLPVKMFDEMASNVSLLISCKNFRKLSPGMTAFIECAPSASYKIIFDKNEYHFMDGFRHSGFKCIAFQREPFIYWYNCSFCIAGTKSDLASDCLKCPAGGFYQDEMGQIKCKKCNIGTYVPEKDHPGKSATDCRACPYGTQSNETAGYRACRCLNNFYRFDRFGPCTACPEYGLNCDSDTAILAANYYWKWKNQAMENYTKFVKNIHTFGPEYDNNFSTFQVPLPKPLKCPYPGSCKGGISSACNVGYQGTLCATCSSNYYLRFNSCLQCPRMVITITSCVGVILVFALLFVMVFWGDSRRAGDDRTRTVADVIMSCAKIVIGFYQVVAGIFSALLRVQWPVILISMEKYLKLVEGNILQFAPLSCIHPLLRLDPFLQFVLAIGINIIVVFLILLYLFLRKRCINKMEILQSQKDQKISSLKKSCYRNIFLFLLLSYPMTSKKIIDILPLPGVCVDMCFTKDGSECVSLLKADYSIHCLTHRHNVYWHIAAAFAVYPVFFPLLLLIPIYIYRKANPDVKEVAFGLRVLFENYKEKYWFWETVEMYRKLFLISIILLFGSESRSQIGFAVIAASASGIAYTIFRPIKGKFEDRLQTFVLWIIFFNVCLGAIYSQPVVGSSRGENNSIPVNVLFVVINSAVLLLAVGKGLIYLKSVWRKISHCPMRCYHLICRGCCNCRCRDRDNDNLLNIQRTEELLPVLE
ncbi:uncharacterized protein LOC144633754 isoform X1 [Oculina patagonica]